MDRERSSSCRETQNAFSGQRAKQHGDFEMDEYSSSSDRCRSRGELSSSSDLSRSRGELSGGKEDADEQQPLARAAVLRSRLLCRQPATCKRPAGHFLNGAEHRQLRQENHAAADQICIAGVKRRNKDRRKKKRNKQSNDNHMERFYKLTAAAKSLPRH